jgi:hypothetical protein
MSLSHSGYWVAVRRESGTSLLWMAFGLAVTCVFLFFALPPLISFISFLLSGDIWRGLLAAALISLLVGLALAVLMGLLAEGTEASPGASGRPARSRGLLWSLVWILILVAPVACILVALIASGALVEIINWVGDRISNIRDAQ